MRWYLYNVIAGVSHLVNAILCGNPNHSLCARVHWDRVGGGPMSRIWLPGWFVEHCRMSALGDELSELLDRRRG